MSALSNSIRAPRHQRGLAMVEFAVAVPVILLLMFGSFEFGHLLNQYLTLNDAVRNAARYVSGAVLVSTAPGMATGSTWTNLQTQGTNLALYGNIAGTGNTVLPSMSSSQITISEDITGENITVAASYAYVPMFGASIPTFMGGSLSTAFTMNLSTTMRAL